MGFKDYLRVASEQAKAALAEYTEGDSEGAARLATAMTVGSDLKKDARTIADRGIAAVTQTSSGQKTAAIVRHAQTEVGQLPGLTALGDTSRALYGIPSLSQRLVDEPDNPWAYLWLAEALSRWARAQRVMAGARALVEPSSLITRAAIGELTLASDPGRPLEERLLRSCYVLAGRSLGSDSRADMLHALSRVYRAAGKSDEALIALQPALLVAGDHQARAYVTAARLHYEARRFSEARTAARVALDLGSTVGNEVLSDVLSAQVSGGWRARSQAVQDAVRLRAEVDPADVVDYYGTFTTAGAALSEAMVEQGQKSGALARRLSGVGSEDLSLPVGTVSLSKEN